MIVAFPAADSYLGLTDCDGGCVHAFPAARPVPRRSLPSDPARFTAGVVMTRRYHPCTGIPYGRDPRSAAPGAESWTVPLCTTTLLTEFGCLAPLSPGAGPGSLRRVYERTLWDGRRIRVH